MLLRLRKLQRHLLHKLPRQPQREDHHALRRSRGQAPRAARARRLQLHQRLLRRHGLLGARQRRQDALKAAGLGCVAADEVHEPQLDGHRLVHERQPPRLCRDGPGHVVRARNGGAAQHRVQAAPGGHRRPQHRLRDRRATAAWLRRRRARDVALVGQQDQSARGRSSGLDCGHNAQRELLRQALDAHGEGHGAVAHDDVAPRLEELAPRHLEDACVHVRARRVDLRRDDELELQELRDPGVDGGGHVQGHHALHGLLEKLPARRAAVDHHEELRLHVREALVASSQHLRERIAGHDELEPTASLRTPRLPRDRLLHARPDPHQHMVYPVPCNSHLLRVILHTVQPYQCIKCSLSRW
mmetsp:Transcript_77376/g.250347  ORF Transcript_77376/g.250347 Transcript_77376/m.250347 type:complete len:357 (+) Transcript_77376:507-1577(+)